MPCSEPLCDPSFSPAVPVEPVVVELPVDVPDVVLGDEGRLEAEGKLLVLMTVFAVALVAFAVAARRVLRNVMNVSRDREMVYWTKVRWGHSLFERGARKLGSPQSPNLLVAELAVPRDQA